MLAFADEAGFSQFLTNWGNVETGGHFNSGHENWSKGNTELNLGIFQINQTWAIRHDTWNWHDSNPHEYAAEEAFDAYKCTHWGLHHMLSMGVPAGWNLTKMLAAFWHGTLNDPSDYATGIYEGHIISAPE